MILDLFNRNEKYSIVIKKKKTISAAESKLYSRVLHCNNTNLTTSLKNQMIHYNKILQQWIIRKCDNNRQYLEENNQTLPTYISHRLDEMGNSIIAEIINQFFMTSETETTVVPVQSR